MVTSANATLRVVCYFSAEDGVYVCQCLEHDIAAEGETVEKAKEAFSRAFIGHHLLCRQFGEDPLISLPQAPPEAWRRWREIDASRQETFRIPSFTIHKRGATEPPSHVHEFAMKFAV